MLNNDTNANFEVDSGAGCSIISELTAQLIDCKINPTIRRVMAYDGGAIQLLGQITCTVRVGDDSCLHTFLVSKGDKINLFGRDLLTKYNFQIVRKPLVINNISNTILSEFESYLCENYKSSVIESVTLDIPNDATPIYMKARQIPIRLKKDLKKELQRLESQGVLTQVYSSKWATPVVTIYKQDGSLRLCADFSCTVNKYLKPVHSPLITLDEAIASVGKARVFSKLDLSQAFMQLPIHSDSRKYLVINTTEGLYQFNYLPFGLTASPGIFQAFISRTLANIPGVLCYQDDILVMSADEASHNDSLRQVLTKLKDAGLKLNVYKCKFFTNQVEYLGYIFNESGVHPNPAKIDAIFSAPVPVDTKQVQSFVGLCNFYSRFIPNFASQMSPFYELLKKNSQFKWTKLHQQSFDKIKQTFVNSNVLQHFNSNFQTCLETDSSSYGLGAVLLQRENDSNHWLPVQFASRTLNAAEKNYSQLEREALSVIFGVDRFRHFLLGSPFIIKNDHKPLHTLFAKDKSVPHTCSARVLRWSLKLSQFDYVFHYSCGKDNVQSDFLSRLPLPETVINSEPFELVFSLNSVNDTFIDHSIVKEHTNADPDLLLLIDYIKQGCPNKINNTMLSGIKALIPYMTLCKGCILYKDRVFLPTTLRQEFLQKIHSDHPGIVAMKSIARELVWYPGIDKDIEYLVSNCPNCQAHRVKPSQNSFITWPTPTRPWSRVHIDHFFYENSTCLIAVDASSHYIEVEIVKNTSVDETVDALRVVFSHHGLPDLLCSDNASCFTSYKFQEFLKNNGVEHITSPPFCPASNGLAERAVRTVKDLLKKLGQDKFSSFKCRIAQVLLYHRSVPNSQSQIAPSIMLNNRKYVNARDKVHPKFSYVSTDNVSSKKIVHFEVGEKVLALNMSRGPKWLKSTVLERLGSNVYNVFVSDLDLVWKRHVTQLSRIITRPSATVKPIVSILPQPEITRTCRTRRPPLRFREK